MSARRTGSLLLRIYLVSVGVLVLLAFVVGLLANVVLVDPWQDFHAPRLRYAAGVFGNTWASDAALEQELQRMKDVGRYQAAVFDWAGRVRASTFEVPPLPLTEEQHARLLEGGVIRLSKACFPAFCPVATLVESQGARVGYAVFHSDVELPRQALIPLGALFGGLLMAAVLLARTFTVPLQRLAAAARALGEGDLSTRTGLHRADEIGQVARAFDEMAARLTAVLESQTVLLANVALEVAVIDRGIGISSEDLAKVGTPFFRADRSRARQTGGVGLELSLSQKIAEAHGGPLTLESEPGLGTTARLRLPWPGSLAQEP